MTITANRFIAVIFLVLGFAALINTLTSRGHSQNTLAPASPAISRSSPAASVSGSNQPVTKSPSIAAVSPFIVQDTDTDSPGTNMVTRIVTFTAAVGGTPAPALQWKVDRGNGFEIIPGATHAKFRIGVAQTSDSGLYSLFATNIAGSVSTTPVPISITEGED
jgi:hypothetical protein